MKKLSILFTAALAALTVFSCAKEENVKDIVPEGPTISFTAIAEGTDVKTVVDASENWANWSASDQLKIIEYADGTKNLEGSAAIATLSSDNKTATFTATITGDFPTGAAASYVAAYPATRLSEGGSSPNTFYRLMMPASQSPVVGSFDPNADLLISAPVSKSDNSRVSDSEELSFRFHRLGTAVKMTLSGLTDGEKLKEVTITAPVNIAGYVRPDMTNGGYVSGVNIPYSSESKTITLTIADWVISGDVDVWFRVLPGSWDSIEIVAKTDEATYYRTADKEPINLTSGAIEFVDGGRTTFAVNMGKYSEAAKQLADGNYLILAKVNENYFAMKAEGVSSDSRMASVDYSGDLSSYAGDADMVWTVTKSGSSYTIENDGKYLGYEGSDNKAFLKAADDNWTTDNYLADILWDGTKNCYHVTNHKNSGRKLGRTASNNWFAFYTTDQQNDLIFVPATVDSKTAVTLSFSESAFNLTTATYDSFTGQTATADPNEAAITGNITYAMDGDAIGSVDATTGAVTLNGSLGTATVTASFAGDATYRSASASYTINVSSASGSQYELVSTVAEVTAGDYIITWDNTYYLPSGATSGTNPAVGDGISVANNKITNTVTTDMVWTFSGNNNDGFTISDGTNILHSTNAAQGISITTNSTRKWTVSVDATYGMLLHGDDGGSRNLAVFNSGSWRYYTTGSSYTGTLRLYKLADSRPEAPISWSVDNGTATFASGGVTYNLPSLSNTEALTVSYASANEAVATVDASGVVTAIGEGTSVISATYDGSDPASTYKSTTVSYTLTVSDNRTPCAAPVFNPGAGEVTAGSTIAITSSTAGATIYYTTGSSDFSAGDWTAYTAPVAVTTACTIKAIATAANYKNSDVSSASYTILANASTVAEVLAGGAATDLKMNNLLVYAVNGKNAIIGDATGKIFLFMTNNLSVGDNISIASATTTDYQGTLEVTGGTITTNSSGNAVDHGTPVNMNDASAASSTYTTFSATGYHSATFVSVTGTQSGRYIQGSQEHTKLYMNVANETHDGKTVTATGYIYSWSSNYSNYNFQLVSIDEDNTTPTISVSPTSLNWATNATDGKTITVTLNGAAAAGDYTYSVTSGTAGDWNISDNSAGTITVSPKAANTSTENDKTLVLTISHKDNTAVTAQVTCTQAKASSGGGETGNETFDSTAQGYSNQQEVSSYSGTSFSVAFNKGSNNNTPKYYNTGSAIRVYGGGYFTVTGASGYTITKIELTFGSSDGSNAITTDVATYSDGTWTGESSSVTFTVGGTTGNRRIQKIKVYWSK